MPCDYDQIREGNIKSYGTKTTHLEIYRDQYADRTHFLFELLQNAEDADSSKVHFSLLKDGLEIFNDGRIFDETDVRGICEIRASKKEGDRTQIGQFGMGFKSVYVYTDCPEIHSGPEHFKVENFVRPNGIRERIPGGSFNTLFVLPFNSFGGDSVEEKARQVGDRLRKLSPRTLLFLQNINEISWTLENGARGTYIREVEDFGSARRITVLAESKDGLDHQEWLVFNRSLGAEYPENVRVEIAFLISQDSKTKRDFIISCQPSPLIVYFPTERETHLGFLIQGPFKTTPARDNIPHEDKQNKYLVKQAALLLVDSLEELRDMGLLSVSLFETLPIKPPEFPEDGPFSMFRPIYDAVREALRVRKLWPAANGKHISIDCAKLARGSDLVKIIDSKQLTDLYELPQGSQWLSTEITENRTPDLHRYLVGKTGSFYDKHEIEPLVPELEVRLEDMISKIDEKFMRLQTDNWVTRLYAQLAQMKFEDKMLRTIKNAPIIRLESGQDVQAFKHNGDPNAFLPTEEESDLPLVKREIAKNKKAREFLLRVGIAEPDLVDEVLEKILINYSEDSIRNISESRHTKDIRKIFKAYQTDSESKKHLLVDRLRETPFLKGVNAATGDVRFKKPSELYFRSPMLELYFEGNRNAWFLAEEYSIPQEKLKEIGVDENVHVVCKEPDYYGCVTVRSWHSNHVRGLDGFDPGATIHGIDIALTNPTFEKSLYIWEELLAKNAGNIKGIVQRATHQTYDNASEAEEFSIFGKEAFYRAWIPDRKSKLHKPSELALEDMHPTFTRHDVLARQLEMKMPIIASAAAELGVKKEHLELLRNNPRAFEECVRLYNKMEKKRLSDENAEKKIKDALSKDMGYKDAVQQVFLRKGKDSDGSSPLPPAPVPDPAGRREKVRREIVEAGEEVRKLSFRLVKAWDKKNESTREDLEMYNQGKCQICGERNAFSKRNGEPYYEAVYLISYKKWLDHVGNVLCLCANCSAKFQHGSVEAEDFVKQIEGLKAFKEGGTGTAEIKILLCGKQEKIKYQERHFMDLQELLKYAPDSSSKKESDT